MRCLKEDTEVGVGRNRYVRFLERFFGSCVVYQVGLLESGMKLG